MSFYQNSIKYCNMAIYCNTLNHNTQYSINLYCFTLGRYGDLYTVQYASVQITKYYSNVNLTLFLSLT